MKIKVKIVVFIVAVFSFGTAFGQTEFVSLASSQLLKGLKDQDYLSKVLAEDEFTLVNKWKIRGTKSGLMEYWEYQSLIFIDMIISPSKENLIIVRIHKDFSDLSERLIQTFPHKRSQEIDNHLEDINFRHLNKESAYSLKYSKDGENVGVDIWFDEPFYYFQYSNWK